MRVGLPFLVVLLALAGSALAQAELPAPLPTLDVNATLPPPDALLAPGEAEAGVAVEAPGVAGVEAQVSAGPGLPTVALAARLDPGLLARLPTPVVLPWRTAASPPLAPRPLLNGTSFTETMEAPQAGSPIARSSIEGEPDPDGGARGAPERDGPDVMALAVGPPTPLDASPVAAGVALGLTGLLAILARLYSRFGPRDVLRAEPRARIHELLAQRPGATLADLAAATGLSRGALVHHCQMLERHGLVTSRHDGLHRRLYPAGPRVDDGVRPPTPGERRVLDLLRERGPLTQGEVAALLGVTPQAVSQSLLRLRREARVEPRSDGGQRRWAAADEPL